MAGLAGEYDVVLVARGDGVIAADVRPLVRVSVTVIAEQGGRREIGSSGGGGRYATATSATNCCRSTSTKRFPRPGQHGRVAPAGAMTVVLGRAGPACCCTRPSATARKATSTGARPPSPAAWASASRPRGVTVVDDGTLANRRGSLNTDDEGNPTQCTTLIEDGILRGFMQDTLNARLMKMPVTGNARRESYAALPMPRMTNTYMLNGDRDPQEIIASVKRGLYAVNFGGGGRHHQWQVRLLGERSLPDRGRQDHRAGQGRHAGGQRPRVAQDVTMIGNDMRLDSGVGVCGKDGQSVPVGVGQPRCASRT